MDYNFEKLWCHDCGASKVGVCTEHGKLKHVPDSLILTRARLTLPATLMIKKEVEGVFAKKLIANRTQFGPVEAPVWNSSSESVSSTPHRPETLRLKVFKDRSSFDLDLKNESFCNWMMFVHVASSVKEQNLVAYQYQDKIYFTSIRIICAGEELKVDYSSEYASHMTPLLNSSKKIDCLLSPDVSPDQMQEGVPDSTVAAPEDSSSKKIMFYVPNQQNQTSPECHNFDDNSTESFLDEGKNEEMSAADLSTNTSSVLRSAFLGKKSKKKDSRKQDQKTGQSMAPSKLALQKSDSKSMKYRCDEPGCGKEYLTKMQCNRHQLIHTAPQSFKCPFCEKGFKRSDHLKCHISTHDRKKPLLTCKHCGKQYVSRFVHKMHVAIHEVENGNQTVCPICFKHFENKPDHIYHLKVHGGLVYANKEKNEKCPYCDKCFINKKDVRRHLVVHTRHRDFLCQFCSQTFGRLDHLKRHLRSHSGDKLVDKLSYSHKESRKTVTCKSLLKEAKNKKNGSCFPVTRVLILSGHHQTNSCSRGTSLLNNVTTSEHQVKPSVQFQVTNKPMQKQLNSTVSQVTDSPVQPMGSVSLPGTSSLMQRNRTNSVLSHLTNCPVGKQLTDYITQPQKTNSLIQKQLMNSVLQLQLSPQTEHKITESLQQNQVVASSDFQLSDANASREKQVKNLTLLPKVTVPSEQECESNFMLQFPVANSLVQKPVINSAAQLTSFLMQHEGKKLPEHDTETASTTTGSSLQNIITNSPGQWVQSSQIHSPVTSSTIHHQVTNPSLLVNSLLKSRRDNDPIPDNHDLLSANLPQPVSNNRSDEVPLEKSLSHEIIENQLEILKLLNQMPTTTSKSLMTTTTTTTSIKTASHQLNSNRDFRQPSSPLERSLFNFCARGFGSQSGKNLFSDH